MAKFTEIIQCVKKTRDYADANVFMRPFEIYRAALYNVYGGSRVTDVPYIIIIIIIYMDCERSPFADVFFSNTILLEDMQGKNIPL